MRHSKATFAIYTKDNTQLETAFLDTSRCNNTIILVLFGARLFSLVVRTWLLKNKILLTGLDAQYIDIKQ